jgi:signal peptidase I
MPGTQTLLRVLLIALAAPLVWFFAPLQLHGHTGYTIVSGISMEPHVHDGDLVLIHEQSNYKPGAVVAYRSRTEGIVLHRVVRITPDGEYIFRGDNNVVDDPPVAVQDLIGQRWLRIPKAGAAMLWVRKPWHEILLVAIVLLLSGISSVSSRRRRPVPAAGEDPPERRARRVPASNALLVAGILLALAGGAWIVARNTPTTRSALDTHLFHESARLAASATVPRSSVYPDGKVHPDDAVFTRVVHSLDVAVDYGLTSALPAHADGTLALLMTERSDNGWHPTKILARVPLSATSGHAAATIDLDALQRTRALVDSETGVRTSDFTVTFTGQVTMRGHAGSTPISSRFAPTLVYTLDGNRLLPMDATRPTVHTHDGSGIVSVPNTFHLGFVSVSVTRARLLAGWAAIVAVLCVLGALVLLRAHHDEPSRIAWRYRDWLVPITQFPPTTGTITDVGEFEALVQLADRHNKSILHLDEGDEHVYLVKENGGYYRYVSRASGAAPRTVRATAPSSQS